jgi:hypothetical protein
MEVESDVVGNFSPNTQCRWECEKICFKTYLLNNRVSPLDPMPHEMRHIPVCLQVGTPHHLFIYCDSPPVNYLFILRDIPQNYLNIFSTVIPWTVPVP